MRSPANDDIDTAPSRPVAAPQYRWRRGQALALVFGISCTEASDERRFPPVDAELRVVSAVPENGAVDVDPQSTIDICFSGLIDPRALGSFNVSLSSGENTFDTDQSLQFFPWRAPGKVDMYADHAWCPGSVLSIHNREPLAPGPRYRARIRSSRVGWSGESLDTTTPGWFTTHAGEREFYVEFAVASSDDDPDSTGTGDESTTSADDDGEHDTSLEPTTLLDLFAPGEVFDPAMGYCSCHVQDDEVAIARVDLSTPERAWAGLVLDTRATSTGFTRVAPRRPASSHLIHVLLRDNEGRAIRGILGAPMPPEASLPYPHMVSIARWIADGARYE